MRVILEVTGLRKRTDYSGPDWQAREVVDATLEQREGPFVDLSVVVRVLDTETFFSIGDRYSLRLEHLPLKPALRTPRVPPPVHGLGFSERPVAPQSDGAGDESGYRGTTLAVDAVPV